jgi:hypothetical protein
MEIISKNICRHAECNSLLTNSPSVRETEEEKVACWQWCNKYLAPLFTNFSMVPIDLWWAAYAPWCIIPGTAGSRQVAPRRIATERRIWMQTFLSAGLLSRAADRPCETWRPECRHLSLITERLNCGSQLFSVDGVYAWWHARLTSLNRHEYTSSPPLPDRLMGFAHPSNWDTRWRL